MIQKTYTINTSGKDFYILNNYIDDFLSQVNGEYNFLYLFVKHTTASLVITENYDRDVKKDLFDFLEKLAPEDNIYRHSLEGLDDMPAHIKNFVLPTFLIIPLQENRPNLGTWQNIYLLEHKNSPQQRKVVFSAF